MNNQAESERNLMFFKILRRALQHLHDPVELRRDVLLDCLNIPVKNDRVAETRQLLRSEIEKMKPEGYTPSESAAWRRYEILTMRFIEQVAQKVIATDIGVSLRQLQRLEVEAITALADQLKSRYNLNFGAVSGSPTKDTVLGRGEEILNETDLLIEREFDLLRQSGSKESISPVELFTSISETLALSIPDKQCPIRFTVEEYTPNIYAQGSSLRHALLLLLSSCGGETITVNASRTMREILIIIWYEKFLLPKERLDTARRLINLSEGKMSVEGEMDPESRRIKIYLPAVQEKLIIGIDDNIDVLKLIERSLAGTRYAFLAQSDPLQVIEAAIKYRPSAIILDVMIPIVDGWQLLGQIRANPATSAIPVIICSILPQKEFALSLGADAFLHKPFNQKDLLDLLEQVVP